MNKIKTVDWLVSKSVLAKAFPSTTKDSIKIYRLDGTLEQISNINHTKKNKSIFLNSGICEKRKITTINTVPKFFKQKNLGEIIQNSNEIENEFWLKESEIKKWEEAKNGGKKERTSKSGFKYKFSEGKMAFPDKLEIPARTIITSEGGNTPSRFKHVIFQNGKYRRLTPIELERLNLFPDDFTKIENITNIKRAFLMGNALVIGIVEKIRNQIEEVI